MTQIVNLSIFYSSTEHEMSMKLDIKEAPPEVKSWFRRAEEATGMSKSAIVTGIVMDFLAKVNQKKLQNKTPEPKKPAA